jgi:hypothetical protein
MDVGTKTLIPDDAVQKKWTRYSNKNAVNSEQNSQAIPSHETLKEIFIRKCFVFHFVVKQFELAILVLREMDSLIT